MNRRIIGFTLLFCYFYILLLMVKHSFPLLTDGNHKGVNYIYKNLKPSLLENQENETRASNEERHARCDLGLAFLRSSIPNFCITKDSLVTARDMKKRVLTLRDMSSILTCVDKRSQIDSLGNHVIYCSPSTFFFFAII